MAHRSSSSSSNGGTENAPTTTLTGAEIILTGTLILMAALFLWVPEQEQEHTPDVSIVGTLPCAMFARGIEVHWTDPKTGYEHYVQSPDLQPIDKGDAPIVDGDDDSNTLQMRTVFCPDKTHIIWQIRYLESLKGLIPEQQQQQRKTPPEWYLRGREYNV